MPLQRNCLMMGPSDGSVHVSGAQSFQSCQFYLTEQLLPRGVETTITF